LIGAVVALAIFAVYLFVQVDRTKTDVAKLRESLMTEISNMRDASTVTTEAQRKHLDTLRDQLEAARKTAALAAGQAKTEALRHAEELAKRLEEEQQKQKQMVATELSEVKEAASSANTKIASVSSDVNTVRSEVASTKSELDRTIAALKSVQGDLGVQSGLIATNAKELAALRSLGERNYFEFDLTKSKEMRKIGDVTMRLKKADVKRNRYTIELVADDKLVEKKDRSVNEPVQFYVARARLPYEVVVNEVRKDQIVGYLATPKVQVGRTQ
jgi:chromosome segregation ATPase